MIVGIHQPNFFPWLGYFDKLNKSDVFILLDDVQFPRRGAGAYSNRVKLLISGEPRWITASIERKFQGTRNINEMILHSDVAWRSKIIKTIETNYKKTKFFDSFFPFLQNLILNPEENLALFNSKAIHSICKKLGLDTGKISKSSNLDHQGDSNQLLISLTRAIGGSTYMSGSGGASSYLDETAYSQAGITLRHQAFVHPQYSQHNSTVFQPGLSIIDPIMNLGFDETRQLLEN
jgi:hypothetical protein